MSDAARPDQARPAAGGATVVRAAPPKLALRGVTGAYFGKVIPLSGRITIGRDPASDLVIDEAEVSRHHAVIDATPAGMFLRDQGSANGTFVNGGWVKDVELKVGDQIGFDRNRFLVESLSDARARVSSAPAAAAPATTGGGSGLRWAMLAVLAIAAAAVAWIVLTR
ncbi:MAG: FHA domain-containing protein [Pseudoxanthomonas sp.]|nr:FHA domain-containing protein [Pseudoxanthomonas sp.]